jgi:vitamin-K-epoxide reductase (warfarin-sensitive)
MEEIILNEMNKKRWIVILCILGIITASYLTYMFYSDSHEVCDINNTFNCTTVHESDYAVFSGVPVAILGIVGYFFILAFSFYSLFYAKWLSFVGLLFQLRLTYAEFFVIHKLCIFCLISQGIILLIFLLCLNWKRIKRKTWKKLIK